MISIPSEPRQSYRGEIWEVVVIVCKELYWKRFMGEAEENFILSPSSAIPFRDFICMPFFTTREKEGSGA